MVALPDPRRVIGNLMRLCTIDSIDRAQGTCRVRIGEIVSGDVPWLAARAGATRHWSPPSVGEQALFLCPEGDDAAGIVLPGLYSDANSAPASDDIDLIRFADGAVLSYDATAHCLVAQLPQGATAEIAAPGGITLTGDVTISGKLAVGANVHATGDVVAGDISLQQHKHGLVKAGTDKSGAPE